MNKSSPISEDPLAKILGEGGLLSRALDGTTSYEARPAQLRMARDVMCCLERDEDAERLVVEAGTGTGKTLAYLASVVLSGLKAVISTGTHTLQEQIVSRDIPLLARTLGVELRVACMKGIGNYLCLRRFDERRRLESPLAPDPHLARIARWAGMTETGDRAELDLPDGAQIWAEVSPTPETRLGARCPHYDDCFITSMRRRAAAARIVVVNHHLLLADMALRSAYPDAGVIPPYEALIIDEAHEIEQIATGFFGRGVSTDRFVALARDVRRAAQLERPIDDNLARMADRVLESSAELFHILAQEFEGPGQEFEGRGQEWGLSPGREPGRELGGLSPAREPGGLSPECKPGGLSPARRPPARRDGGNGLRLRLSEPPLASPVLQQTYFVVDAALEAMLSHLERLAAPGRDELANLARRAGTLRDSLALFADLPQRGYIFWAESRRHGTALHASPVEVGPMLQTSLLAQQVPIVFTSATLATSAPQGPTKRPAEFQHSRRGPQGTEEPELGDSPLAYFRARVGLVESDEAYCGGPIREVVLTSPFDFEHQALLYLARDLPDPNTSSFIARAAERIAQLIDMTSGRALVLFTSYRNLQAVHELLRGRHRVRYSLLRQGSQPRTQLLEAFRDQVQSVLLATASFWQGVDVVGESLSLVIVDRLPFAVPDDPLTAARIERLTERGLSPFLTYQLPQALLTLKQGFGRLIRHRQDRGVVAILDRRIVERPYGRILLANLPPAPRTSDLLKVRAFCRELGLT